MSATAGQPVVSANTDAKSAVGDGTLSAALRQHWPEYLMEAAGLGLFMISAATFGTLLEHPGSPLRQAIADPMLRRVPMGLAMGLTAIVIICSPWGQQSGAHLNPAVTLTFWRLGKVAPWDALFYALAQFVGGSLGLALVAAVVCAPSAGGCALAHPAVNFVVTQPGMAGLLVAFLAEAAIAFGLMLVVLTVSNAPRLARFTPLCAGALVASYIILEAPFSGMSLNPARTFASALAAGDWTALWLYFVAPPLGMLLAAQLYLAIRRPRIVACAKLHHHNTRRCIFRCSYQPRSTEY